MPTMPARRWRKALFALALCIMASCSTAARPDTSGGTLRYLALGDSYTIGEGIEPEGRWTHQLAAALRNHGIALGEPQTIARTGWTTDELSAAIDEAAPASDFDFVTLLIGVNNQYRGRDAGEFATEFDALLQRAIGFANGRSDRVLVLSIPDWGATVFGRASGRDLAQLSREIDAYNAAQRAVCERHGVAFVDITPASRDDAMNPDLLAEDGLHPSAAMYARWSALAAPVATRMLATAAP